MMERYYAQTGQFDGSVYANNPEEAARQVIIECANTKISLGSVVIVSRRKITCEDSGYERIFPVLSLVSDLSKEGHKISAKLLPKSK